MKPEFCDKCGKQLGVIVPICNCTPMNQNPNTNKEDLCTKNPDNLHAVRNGETNCIFCGKEVTTPSPKDWGESKKLGGKLHEKLFSHRNGYCDCPKDWEESLRDRLQNGIAMEYHEVCDFIRQERTNAQKEIIEIAIKEVEELETIKGSTTDGFKAVAVYRLSHLLD